MNAVAGEGDTLTPITDMDLSPLEPFVSARNVPMGMILLKHVITGVLIAIVGTLVWMALTIDALLCWLKRPVR